MNDILAGISQQADNSKVIDPYRKKIESIEKNHCTMENASEYERCADELEKAEKIYKRVPKDRQSLKAIVDLRARHDKLYQVQKDMKADVQRKDQEYWANSKNDSDFRKKAESLRFAYLESGKNNTAISIQNIEAIDKAMPEFKIFHEGCEGQYKEIVAKNVNVGFGYDAQQVCEMAKNREQYRNQAVIATYEKYLAEQIANLTEVIDNFKKDNYLETAMLNRFLYEYDTYYQDVVNTVSAAYKSAGQAPPSFEQLKNLEKTFKPVLESALSKNKWDDSNFESVSSPIKKLAARKAEKMGFKLLDLGYSEDAWVIIKNALGTPTSKYIGGYVLMKKPNESFCRKYYARFFRIYTGSSFESASNIEIVSTVTPVPM